MSFLALITYIYQEIVEHNLNTSRSTNCLILCFFMTPQERQVIQVLAQELLSDSIASMTVLSLCYGSVHFQAMHFCIECSFRYPGTSRNYGCLLLCHVSQFQGKAFLIFRVQQTSTSNSDFQMAIGHNFPGNYSPYYILGHTIAGKYHLLPIFPTWHRITFKPSRQH